MTFPQRWNPATATLHINVMLIPSISPVDDPVLGGSSPKFADHAPTLRANVIPSLDVVPTSTDPTIQHIVPTILHPSPSAPTRANYDKLVAQATAQGITVSGTGAMTSPSQSSIRKALPQSYLNATGASPSGATATEDEFGCAVRGQTVQKPGPKQTTVGWGPVISYALRQRMLATKLGLRYAMEVKLHDSMALSAGSWLFIDIDPSDPWAAGQTNPPTSIRLYAARLPRLADRRPLFAAVLFPVDATGTIDDNAFSVAETYDDGFAQIVHVNQPQSNDAVLGDGNLSAPADIGVQIGWDDEQVVAWQNGQIDILNARMSATGLTAQTPLGVLGYRVDVADVTTQPPAPDWHSLLVAKVKLPRGFGTFDGELAIEPTALRPQDPNNPTVAWLPRYFAHWRGGSLAVSDPVPPAMLAGRAITAAPDPVGVLLSYGRTYSFRVRLVDLSSGGAVVHEQPVNIDPADVATIDFRRAVPPKAPGITVNLAAGDTSGYGQYPPPSYVIPEPESLTFTRPLIGYPEVLYTSLGDTDANRGKIVEYFTKHSHPGSGAVVGLPDPDAETLEVTVEVRTPAHDAPGDGVLDGPFRKLYTTTRTFPALGPGPLPTDPGLRVDLAYVDAPSIVDWEPQQPTSGPLVIPRARDVCITARALTRDDPSYFYDVATTGLVATIVVRAELRNEPSLLIRPIEGSPPIRGFLFKRPPSIDAPPVAAQLGQELNVAVDGLTFSAPPGHRIAFGASKAIRHTLSGDNSTITFASESELLRQWIVVIVADLERDWTWDGLAGNDTVSVSRDGELVGGLQVVRTLGSASVADPANWDRYRTRLIFFDGVDPHEATPSGFPQALKHSWKLDASTIEETKPIIGVSGTPKVKPGSTEPTGPDLNHAKQSLTLPIAVPPSQIPEIASVGLALSPFTAGPGYTSTSPRTRALWLEFKAPLDNPTGDAPFARVLAHGADPLLYDATPNTDQPQEPPLVLDPELMRAITPGESDDRAGLDAMTMLQSATNSNVHFLLPLPPGIDPDDPELFGFYTYELRIGHAGNPHDHRWWSTTQGRFGRPLRVSGVQHPAPGLVCRAGRLREDGGKLVKRVPNELRTSITAGVEAVRERANVISVHDISRLSTFILATATYATPVLDGKPLVSSFDRPKTQLYFFLYAQVVQADAASNRNVLLFQRLGIFFGRERSSASVLSLFGPTSQRDRIGGTVFSEVEVEDALTQMGLPPNLPLSVLAVEFLPGGVGNDLPQPDDAFAAREVNAVAEKNPDPLNLNRRPRRILRTSPLVPVATIC
jgi:hypothetical protein